MREKVEGERQGSEKDTGVREIEDQERHRCERERQSSSRESKVREIEKQVKQRSERDRFTEDEGHARQWVT